MSLLRSPYESVRGDLAGTLVHEQYHGRLDAAWYPLLNEVFEKDISKETRGNAALILILADDPQSAEKLKFIESLCVLKHAHLPLDKAKIYKELSEHLPYGLDLSYVLQRWNPSWEPGFRRTPIGGWQKHHSFKHLESPSPWNPSPNLRSLPPPKTARNPSGSVR